MMSAEFHCRTMPGSKRFYMLLAVQNSDDLSNCTASFDLYTCPCGRCGKDGEHFKIAFGQQEPFDALNKFIGKTLFPHASAEPPSATAKLQQALQPSHYQKHHHKQQNHRHQQPPPPPACNVEVDLGTSTVLASVIPGGSESTRDALMRFAAEHGITTASHGDGAFLPLYRRLEQVRMDASPLERTFMMVENPGQGNIVAEHLAMRHGMREVYDISLQGISFKWVTWPRQADFGLFREGRDIVNTIEGIVQLDLKDLMQRNIEAFAVSDACQALSGGLYSGRARCLRPAAFFPATYALNSERDCQAWAQDVAARPHIDWLVKPPDTFAGDGLRFVEPEEAARVVAGESCGHLVKGSAGLPTYGIHGLPADNQTWVQQYIANPALANGTKHSLRSYALILSVDPPLFLFHEGMAYRSLVPYARHAADRAWSRSADKTGLARLAHITNIQSNHPEWEGRKADGLLSWQQFAESLDDSLPGRRFTHGRLFRQAAAITSFAIRSCLHGLQHRNGSFELMAVDYTVDTTGRLWLHEFNVAPAIDSGGPSFAPEWKREMQYDMARGAVDLVLETFRLQNGAELPSLLTALRPHIARTQWQVAYAEDGGGHVEFDAVAELLPHEAELLAIGGRGGGNHDNDDGDDVAAARRVAEYGDFLNLISSQVAMPAALLESHVPQGMEWLAAAESGGGGETGFLVSMYAREDSSAILVFLGERGGVRRHDLANEDGTPFLSHAGGLALVGGLVWVCNEGVHGAQRMVGELVAFQLPSQPEQQQRSSPLRALRRVVVDSRASFVSTSRSERDVCVGEFAFQGRDAFPVAPHHLDAGAGNTAWVACYNAEQLLAGINAARPLEIDIADGVAVPRPTTVFLTGDGVQGLVSGDGDFAVLSVSFGPGDSLLQYHALALHGAPLVLAPPLSRVPAFSIASGTTLANKVFMPALSQDLAFVRHPPAQQRRGAGTVEVAVAFEGASSAYRDMVDELGWSAKDSHVHVLRLPKWRTRDLHFPNVTAIGHRPATGSSPATDQRAAISIVIDGKDRMLRFERGLSRAEAMSEGRWFCAWNDIRDANCPSSIASAVQNET